MLHLKLSELVDENRRLHAELKTTVVHEILQEGGDMVKVSISWIHDYKDIFDLGAGVKLFLSWLGYRNHTILFWIGYRNHTILSWFGYRNQIVSVLTWTQKLYHFCPDCGTCILFLSKLSIGVILFFLLASVSNTYSQA